MYKQYSRYNMCTFYDIYNNIFERKKGENEITIEKDK